MSTNNLNCLSFYYYCTTFFITKAIKKGHVECTGGELNEILPPTSRKRGARENKKQFLLKKIKKIVEVFAGI